MCEGLLLLFQAFQDRLMRTLNPQLMTIGCQ